MDGNSLNITQDLLEKLKELVPQAFNGEKLDMQKTQTSLHESECMKIKCSEKQFATFSDVRFQVVGSVGDLKTL